MTDATRGLARYELEDTRPAGSYTERLEMVRADDGDWVRYEDAARIQRARARNLVGRLRLQGVARCSLDVFDRNARWADRIAAKYLGEGT